MGLLTDDCAPAVAGAGRREDAVRTEVPCLWSGERLQGASRREPGPVHNWPGPAHPAVGSFVFFICPAAMVARGERGLFHCCRATPPPQPHAGSCQIKYAASPRHTQVNWRPSTSSLTIVKRTPTPFMEFVSLHELEIFGERAREMKEIFGCLLPSPLKLQHSMPPAAQTAGV